ncbi:MAG: NADH:ubiquinone oxidoreductase [Armatimonadetes bacterium]|nr:NADH:ubiquinone oxidoreductase [Armatimonadota bacterium]
MAKPTVAVFSFTGCEGCSLAILECENELLDIINLVEFVEWREAMSEKTDQMIDIGFVDGAISTHHDEKKIREIRERVRMLVPIGACAVNGGVNALKNRYGMSQVKEMVYGEAGAQFDTIPARPVHAVVPVEFEIPGCPMNSEEFLRVVADIAVGKTPRLPNYPVCVECKRKGNVCVFEKGMICMGPIARAGCGADCPSYGAWCEACRGFVDNPNDNAHWEVLQKYGLTVEEIMQRYDMFCAYELEERKAQAQDQEKK